MNKIVRLRVPGWPNYTHHIKEYGPLLDNYDPHKLYKYFIWFKHIGDPRNYPNNLIYNGSVLDLIPDEYIGEINKGKIHVIVDTMEESWGPIYQHTINQVESLDIHLLLEENAKKRKIDPSKIIWVTGDMNAETYCSESNVIVKSVCQFLFSFSSLVDKEEHTHINHEVDNFLICPNRFPKAHRAYVVTRLAELEQNDISIKFSFPKTLSHYPASTIVDAFNKLRSRKENYPEHFDRKELIDWKKLEQQCHNLYQKLPRKIDDVNFDTNDCSERDSIESIKDYYHRSAFCLVTETWAEGGKIFISDAILAPILFQTPFLVVGCRGSLKFLKSKGFLTFNSIIDESYDLIDDDVERWSAVLDQVEILSRRDWVTDRKKLDRVVTHNFNHLFSLAPHEIRDFVSFLRRV